MGAPCFSLGREAEAAASASETASPLRSDLSMLWQALLGARRFKLTADASEWCLRKSAEIPSVRLARYSGIRCFLPVAIEYHTPGGGVELAVVEPVGKGGGLISFLGRMDCGPFPYPVAWVVDWSSSPVTGKAALDMSQIWGQLDVAPIWAARPGEIDALEQLLGRAHALPSPYSEALRLRGAPGDAAWRDAHSATFERLALIEEALVLINRPEAARIAVPDGNMSFVLISGPEHG